MTDGADRMHKLYTFSEKLRNGWPGTLIFWGYFVAISVMLAISVATHNTLQRNQDRSCRALKGAVEFWEVQLKSEHIALSDIFLSPTQRKSHESMAKALTVVIAEGSKLTCDGGNLDRRG